MSGCATYCAGGCWNTPEATCANPAPFCDKCLSVHAAIGQLDVLRAVKNFLAADELRNQLTAFGVVVENTKEGTRWHWRWPYGQRPRLAMY